MVDNLSKKNISTRKRRKTPKDKLLELAESYEQAQISKDQLESGKYLREFLAQTSSEVDVQKAIRLTIDALLESIASDFESLSSAALIPHPDSKDTKVIIRGPLKKEIAIKIVEIFRKYPPVINDLLGSEDEIKVLDSGIGYVVLENCRSDSYLVGIVEKNKDVDELARRLNHVQKVVKDNYLLKKN